MEQGVAGRGLEATGGQSMCRKVYIIYIMRHMSISSKANTGSEGNCPILVGYSSIFSMHFRNTFFDRRK